MIAYDVQITTGYSDHWYGLGVKGQGQINVKYVKICLAASNANPPFMVFTEDVHIWLNDFQWDVNNNMLSRSLIGR